MLGAPIISLSPLAPGDCRADLVTGVYRPEAECWPWITVRVLTRRPVLAPLLERDSADLQIGCHVLRVDRIRIRKRKRIECEYRDAEYGACDALVVRIAHPNSIAQSRLTRRNVRAETASKRYSKGETRFI